MREAIKQAVIQLVPELAGRIYDAHPPESAADDFFAVVQLGEDVWKSPWAGYRQVIRLKLYAGGTAAARQLDSQAERLIQGLHRKRVTGPEDHAFKLHYLGVPEADQRDFSLGRTLRVIRFGVYVPEASASGHDSGSNGEPDEWLSALIAWTSKQLGSSWSVYRTAWPADREDHAVLWRLSGCETKMAGASVYEISKSFTGHVASTSSEHEQLTAFSLVESLGSEAQLLLDPEAGRYLSVAGISGDLEADAILNGQLKLTLIQRQMRSAQEAARIRRVHVHPILN
ncbi:hypothetical protein BBD41_19135 [Paenibacillus ihbetae]|uniref:Uncharacterized protein n=1 Tax=Paenibacillus ihbetae TaxID=1870820 RepID=A0A1B2E3N0_9BACL|nr:hypothetical protein [Paenibacillus ihbetae]ANY74512.1 hypothetical protein BBD41_19135 [Paenibacillus ihbetae]